MRLLLDTNVLVAALATRGLCADVLRVVLADHELVMTRVVLDELERALREKIGLPASRIAAAIQLLSPFLAEGDGRLVEEAPFSLRDPDDEAVVRSAIPAGAELIVTGDKDLLDAQLPLPVLTPRALWETLRGGDGGVDEVHEPVG